MKEPTKDISSSLNDYIGDNAGNFCPLALRKWIIENMSDELKEYQLSWTILNELEFEPGCRFIVNLYSIADDLYCELQKVNEQYPLENVINYLKEQLSYWIHDYIQYNSDMKEMLT